MMKDQRAVSLLGLALLLTAQSVAQDREAKVHNDKSKFEADDQWIYGDLDLAFSLARSENKPLMVVFRCIP